MVFRAAYRITGNPTDAEDVLQTVFLRMLKRDPGASPWAICPASSTAPPVNAALDLVRSRQNIRNIPLDDLEPVLADPAHRRPDRIHGSGEIREWLRGAMARLNPRHRPDVSSCASSKDERIRKSRVCSTPRPAPWR